MAKGSLAKEKIFEKMLEVFEGSFMYNNGKELRIPFDEEGKLVEIKVALTCAKDLVGSGNEVMKPAAAPSATAHIKYSMLFFICLFITHPENSLLIVIAGARIILLTIIISHLIPIIKN